MNKRSPGSSEPEMLAGHGSGGVRGKHARRFAGGSNIAVIDADVAKVFPDSESVNQALRAVCEIMTQLKKRTKTTTPKKKTRKQKVSD